MHKEAAAIRGPALLNPVPVMKLVEVVRTIATDPAVYEEMVAFGAKLGKTPVRAHDGTGFIVNRCSCRIYWMRFARWKKALDPSKTSTIR